MVDPHKEKKKESRRQRLRAWFAALGIKGKTFTIISGVIVLLLLIFAVVAITLFVKSLTNDDLALYLATDTTILALHPAETAELSIVMSAKNLPFCTAQCSYTATDHLTGAVFATGDVALRTGMEQSVTMAYTAPSSYERDGLLTVALTCFNTPSNLCKSDGFARYSTAAVRVISRYTDEQAAAQRRFTTAIDLRRDEIAQTRADVFALAERVTDRRVQDIVDEARRDTITIDATLLSIAALLTQERYDEAEVALASLTMPSSLSRYRLAQETEQQARATLASLILQSDEILRFTPLLNVTTVERIRDARMLLARASTGFPTSNLSVTLQRLTTVNAALEPVQQTLNATVNTTLTLAETLLAQDEKLRCSLYTPAAFACPPIAPVENASLKLRFSAYCAIANETSARFIASRLAYARAAVTDENASLAQALTVLNVSDVIAQPTFAPWRNNTLLALYAGTPVSLTSAETLALDPAPLVTEALVNCSPFSIPSIALPNATLPVLDPIVDAIPSLITVPRQCCDDGYCVACPAVQRTPVVFVHGFSFAQGTTPESNLNAFAPLTRWLDTRDTARYIGHVFAQESSDEDTFASSTGLPGRYSMTATYYYDSYSEEGKLSLVAQKTENLETYAIRLREAINVAKARTGNDKVIVVAHSMGGLVARRYLQLFGEDSVVAIIMIGTPNNGITGRTDQFCSVLGSALECRDMEAGSLFMTKLTNGRKPSVPVYTIAGVGCDTSGEEGDGVITKKSVALSWATNIVVNGTCSGRTVLHSSILDPAAYPTVAETVEDFIRRY